MHWITKFAISLHANTTQNRGGVPSVWLSWVMGSGDSWVQVTHPASLAPPVTASESMTTPLALALPVAPHCQAPPSSNDAKHRRMQECEETRREVWGHKDKEGIPRPFWVAKGGSHSSYFFLIFDFTNKWGYPPCLSFQPDSTRLGRVMVWPLPDYFQHERGAWGSCQC
jgi:hypothetical protein